jgi:hypothetical protein
LQAKVMTVVTTKHHLTKNNANMVEQCSPDKAG